jgi:hypothetical protein
MKFRLIRDEIITDPQHCENPIPKSNVDYISEFKMKKIPYQYFINHEKELRLLERTRWGTVML